MNINEVAKLSVVRAFIAIELSPEIYERLDQVIIQLKDCLSGMSPFRGKHWRIRRLPFLTTSASNLGRGQSTSRIDWFPTWSRNRNRSTRVYTRKACLFTTSHSGESLSQRKF